MPKNIYSQHASVRNIATPQNQPIPESGQVANSAGGYAWQVTDWQQLDRFLILGTEGGTYYIGEQKLTVDNAQAVKRCLAQDGPRVVKRIVEISEAGRAIKNDPALFALALATASKDQATRQAAYAALPLVARTGTHLFTFIEMVEGQRGWSRGLRRAVNSWYLGKTVDQLAYQLVKYRQRNGWTHRDVLRMSHIKTEDLLFKWAVDSNFKPDMPEPRILEGFFKIQGTQDAGEAAKLILEYRLPREAVPTELLNSREVWDALLESGMPITAMIRNLGNMSKVGLLAQGQVRAVDAVVNALGNLDILKKGRVHPLSVLTALLTYKSGHGVRGHGEWRVVPRIVDALNEAFYLSFGAVEPTGKSTMLLIDVSGSMFGGYYDSLGGVPGMYPALGAAVMAMVTARVEKDYSFLGMDIRPHQMDITPATRLEDVEMKMRDCRWGGGTDLSQGYQYALSNKIPVDLFVTYTDSETWHGGIHPAQALVKYRQQMGIAAKGAVVAMVANNYSVADPKDPGQIDLVGFDTSTPQALSEFARL